MKLLRKVAVGGTFDELHRGHRILLIKAFETGENVIIGLSSDELVAKLGKPHVTATYEERKQVLLRWLKDLGVERRADIIPLFDAFGSAAKDPEIEALIVSKETRPNAKKINNIRRKTGLPLLKIITIDMVPAQNFKAISTTRIRLGEIDHEGMLLKKEGSS